jgi:hypothetical protein
MRPRGNGMGDAATTIIKELEPIIESSFTHSKRAHNESSSSLTKSKSLGSPEAIA